MYPTLKRSNSAPQLGEGKKKPSHVASQLRGNREGLLVDTGARDNLSGSDWVARQKAIAQGFGLDVTYREMGTTLKVEGVGNGTNEARMIADVPIAMLDEIGEFQTPVVENSGLPGLWGIESQHRKRVIVDTGGEACIFPGPQGFKIILSPGSKVARMERAISGHMMLPCSDFQKCGKKPIEQKEPSTRWILYTGGPSGSSSSSSHVETNTAASHP